MKIHNTVLQMQKENIQPNTLLPSPKSLHYPCICWADKIEDWEITSSQWRHEKWTFETGT